MLIGGPGGPDGLPDPMHGVKDSPVYRTLRGVGQLPHDPDGRLHHGAQPGADGLHGRVPARRRPGQGRRPGLVPRPAHLPGRPRHHADRRPPRPDDVPGAGARHHAPERGVGHRQRGGRGAQVGALPDEVRGQAHQDLGVGRGDVVQLCGRVRSSTPTRSWRPSSTRRTATGCASPRTPTATPASGPASGPGSTASSTAPSPATTPSS